MAAPTLALMLALPFVGAGAWAAADAQVAPPPEPTLAQCADTHHATVLEAQVGATPAHARAIWLDRRHVHWPGVEATGRFRLVHAARPTLEVRVGTAVAGADGALVLELADAELPADSVARGAWAGEGITLALAPRALARMPLLHRGQLVLVREDAAGRVLDATRVQVAGALDDLYVAAEGQTLGAVPSTRRTHFGLWAPTARRVTLCLYPDARAAAVRLLPMRLDPLSGAWLLRENADLGGRYYAWLVDVLVPGEGLVRNRVTDPYALSLSADSRRGWIGDLDDPRLAPEGWSDTPRPQRVAANTDMVVYELHVRDFSLHDDRVPAAHRGTYLGFTHGDSFGMRHLRALAQSGITDVHLLPVFDLASVPEQGCRTLTPRGRPAGETQQALVGRLRAQDCYNWGYDPLHFSAPEGSYATHPSDGARRIVEFRRMVQALHRAGLRVGMDVVYNHTSAAGQAPHSVLDRIVPGYYHRLDAEGAVTTSTCCANTATEHRMMAKLMIDSVVTWARDHRIDSFRFDLMGHQPRDVMQSLQRRVDEAAGRHVQLIGEGWNFGEVADGARFVQASQLSLGGSGIATFSDRARDAVRGGRVGDRGEALVRNQGWVNGLVYAPNALAGGTPREALLDAADLVRVGLAGSLRDYPLQTWRGETLPMAQVDYAGQPAGYAKSPEEVVNYVENHDNHTLYDINVLKLPLDTPTAERARVQVLALATVAFSQGIAYFHAGGELLRSKSLDGNSYDSGDWFNRIDWSLSDHSFGSGLPPAWDNAESWTVMRPRLAEPALRPRREDMAYTVAAFRDLLAIRSSTTLLRLRTAADVHARLRLLGTGPGQEPTLLAARLDGRGYAGAGFEALIHLINADTRAHALEVADEAGRPWTLHPVHRRGDAADRRAAQDARYDPASGRFEVPARTAVVFVIEETGTDERGTDEHGNDDDGAGNDGSGEGRP